MVYTVTRELFNLKNVILFPDIVLGYAARARHYFRPHSFHNTFQSGPRRQIQRDLDPLNTATALARDRDFLRHKNNRDFARLEELLALKPKPVY